MIPATRRPIPPVTKQRREATPGPGLGAAALVILWGCGGGRCVCGGGLCGKQQHSRSSVKHISLRLYRGGGGGGGVSAWQLSPAVVGFAFEFCFLKKGEFYL